MNITDNQMRMIVDYYQKAAELASKGHWNGAVLYAEGATEMIRRAGGAI